MGDFRRLGVSPPYYNNVFSADQKLWELRLTSGCSARPWHASSFPSTLSGIFSYLSQLFLPPVPLGVSHAQGALLHSAFFAAESVGKCGRGENVSSSQSAVVLCCTTQAECTTGQHEGQAMGNSSQV